MDAHSHCRCCAAEHNETPNSNCRGEIKESSSCCCSGGGGESQASRAKKLAVAAAALAAGFCIARFGLNFPFFPYSDPSWLAVFLCAGGIFKSAGAALFKERRISVSMLVSLAIAASLGLQLAEALGMEVSQKHGSFIFAAGEIAFLMSLGEWLENRTVSKTKKALEGVAALMPKFARVRRGGATEEISAAQISAGDIVCVNPGEIIPADGVVIKGNTSVNQSNITGESLPADKAEGDAVLCGTFNLSAYIELRATKSGSQTVLTKMIELVGEAEGKKSPISRAANKWASYIVPSALALSALAFVFARFGLGTTFAEALVRAATILVVFCPCAFVLATPAAISAGIGCASKSGVVIGSGEALESFSKITAVFFDKTGTLTTGKISVDKFECAASDKLEILRLAAAAEKASPHPLARALAEYAARQGAGILPEAEGARAQAGGISATVEGKLVQIRKAASEGAKCAVSEIIIGGRSAARVYFADTVRPSARRAAGALKALNIKTAILSGDNQFSVEAVARQTAIEKFSSDMLPHDKLAAIAAARGRGEFVCMVGDGANDAPSLAAADTSAAVADLKNEIAINSAQISILDGDLEKIPALIKFSKSVMNTIAFNIALSLAVSAAAVLLGAFGAITPAVGALVHNASSVAVVANSARLLNKKLKP